MLAAAVAATLAAALAWLGPPGSDFAAHLYQSDLFEEPRLRSLEQLLVRRPLQLRHLQPALLPARGAPRDQAPRGREHRDGGARVRRRCGPRVGPRLALVESLLRRRLGGRSSSRARSRSRSGSRSHSSRSGPCRRGGGDALRSSRCWSLAASPVAFVLLAVVIAGIGLVADAAAGRADAPARDACDRHCRRARPAPPLRGRRSVPVLLARVRRGVCLLWAGNPAHLAGRCSGCVALDLRRLSRCVHDGLPRAVGAGREHRAAPLRRRSRSRS